MAPDFYRQLGTGVSSLTFGVALSVFIFAVASRAVLGITAWLLFATSFLLMLRFWWRYNELFVQFLPSRTFWHFVFDFLAAFFGILAVLFVGDIKLWALAGFLAMVSSMIRCGLSWRDAGKAKNALRNTAAGAAVMAVLLGAVYVMASAAVAVAAGVFVLVLVFVVYSSRKK